MQLHPACNCNWLTPELSTIELWLVPIDLHDDGDGGVEAAVICDHPDDNVFGDGADDDREGRDKNDDYHDVFNFLIQTMMTFSDSRV